MIELSVTDVIQIALCPKQFFESKPQTEINTMYGRAIHSVIQEYITTGFAPIDRDLAQQIDELIVGKDVQVELPITYKLLDFQLKGRIDLFMTDDEKYYIVDWKTSRQRNTKKDELQLGLYGHIIAETHGVPLEKIELILFNTKTKEKKTYSNETFIKASELIYAGFDTLKYVIQNYKDFESKRPAKLNKYCSFCSLLDVCELQPQTRKLEDLAKVYIHYDLKMDEIKERMFELVEDNTVVELEDYSVEIKVVPRRSVKYAKKEA